MWNFVKRGILPVLLISGGAASLIYGSMFHTLPVLTKETTEKTIEVPEPFSQALPGAPDLGGPPQTRKQTVKSTETVLINLSEPTLVRDMTVGGVALNKSFKLERTYTGKAPSLCPT
jgi:hypothetical protein